MLPENHILKFSIPSPVAESIGRSNKWRVRTAELLREAFITSLNPDIMYITSLFEGWFDNAVTSIGSFKTVGKTAVTHYDLIPFFNQQIYLPSHQAKDYYFRKIEFLKNADILLAISEYARQECIDALYLEPERIVNISTAANPVFRSIQFNDQEAQSLYKRYGIRRPFILYTGGFDPRKNLSRLFEAFSLLPSHIRNQYQLLLAGKALQDAQYWLRAYAKKFGIMDQVLITDYVPDEDLAGLYNRCALFVFPSLHEGFGLPALEAMACGAPVIGSNTTSIPEVVGYQDALFDPTDSKSIAQKMFQVLSDEGMQKFLREHGLKQSKNFSWQISAHRAWEAFESVVEQPVDHCLSAGDRYVKLLNHIASIPQDQIRATNRDLIETAQSISENEETLESTEKIISPLDFNPGNSGI